MFFHVGAQQGVHPGLVSTSLLFEPFDHIVVEPERELTFGDRFESAPNDSFCEHLGRHLGDIGKVNIRVGHCVKSFVIGSRFP